MSDNNGKNESGIAHMPVKNSITVSCAGFVNKVEIEMNMESLDVALSLLERAHRILEAKFRFLMAQDFQREAIEHARLAEIAGSLLGRRQ